MKLAFAVVFVAVTSAAVTSATAGPLHQPSEPPRYALAVNSPISWLLSDSSGPLAEAASGYIAINRHQVVRLNAAGYELPGYGELAIALAGAEDECSPGKQFDAGVGWMYFPRERFSGLSLEAGGLVRRRYKNNCTLDEDVVSTTTIVAARGLVGWNWLVRGHLYLAVAAGGSVGDERGRVVRSGYMTGPSSSRVHGIAYAPEFFVRLGWAFL